MQTARFRPKGLAGLMYWYAVLPFHGLVFEGLLHGIAEAASLVGYPSPRHCNTRPCAVHHPTEAV